MAAVSNGFWQRRRLFCLYELIGRAGEHSVHGLHDELRVHLELFQQAHVLFRQRHGEEARKTFQSRLGKWADDGPSRTYWNPCQD